MPQMQGNPSGASSEPFPNTALQHLSTFNKYNWRFYIARTGWRKGNVERSEDYDRGAPLRHKQINLNRDYCFKI